MRTRKIVSAALLVAALAVGTAACGSTNADKNKMEQTSTPSGTMSDNKMSDGKMSDGKTADTKMSDGKMADNATSDSMSDGKMRDDKMSPAPSASSMSDGKSGPPIELILTTRVGPYPPRWARANTLTDRRSRYSTELTAVQSAAAVPTRAPADRLGRRFWTMLTRKTVRTGRRTPVAHRQQPERWGCHRRRRG